MLYFRIPIVDRGYVDEFGNVVDITGRDNIEERFIHLGYTYPAGQVVYEEPGKWIVIESAEAISGAQEVPKPEPRVLPNP